MWESQRQFDRVCSWKETEPISSCVYGIEYENGQSKSMNFKNVNFRVKH